MPFWSSLLLTVAVSLDSIGVGIAYGIRGIRVPGLSLTIIGLCTGSMMTVSMYIGHLLSHLLSFTRIELLGGITLIAIGTWQLLQGWQNYLNNIQPARPTQPLLTVRIPVLGVAIQILKDPTRADANRSGTIDTRESFLLGGALGMDAFAAGFGASMAGFPLWIVPTVALSCVAFVSCGAWVGTQVGGRWFAHRGFALPGLLLIVIGILQL